ncbi:MAG: winged helix-turn-helix transcriptional regulator [Enterocloster clostridioformis]
MRFTPSGKIRFNQTLKVLPISEKVLSQQLKELIDDGLIRSTSYDVIPPKVEYRLTEAGNELIPALDIFYIWAIRQMTDKGIPIDADNFVVHLSGSTWIRSGSISGGKFISGSSEKTQCKE